MEIDKVCRLCGDRTNSEMINVFIKDEISGQQIVHLIKECLPVVIYRNDPLSKRICKPCFGKISQFSSFRKITINVQDKFKTDLQPRLHESHVNLFINIVENSAKKESAKNQNSSPSLANKTVATQTDIETKSIHTETNDLITETNSSTNTDEIRIETTTSSTNTDDVVQIDITTSSTNTEDVQIETTTSSTNTEDVPVETTTRFTNTEENRAETANNSTNTDEIRVEKETKCTNTDGTSDNFTCIDKIKITNVETTTTSTNTDHTLIETKNCSTNTVVDILIEKVTNGTNTESYSFGQSLSILTPSKINANIESCIDVSQYSENGEIIKKRRLNRPRAGPRCKTRPYLEPFVSVKYQPLTLLQCALKQINRNLNLFDDHYTNSLDSFPTTTEAEDSTMDSLYTEESQSQADSQDYDGEYSPSPDISTMESFEFSTEMGYMDTTPSELHPDYNFTVDVDMDSPVMCNYCVKTFPNLTELAGHEIHHIQVDIGPRVGTKEFNMLHTKLAFYYNDYLRRLNILPPKEMKQSSKPITRNIIKPVKVEKVQPLKPVFRAVAVKQTHKPVKPVTRNDLREIKQEVKSEDDKTQEEPTSTPTKPVTRPKSKSISYEETEQTFDEENSLLVPHVPNVNYEFSIVNNEVMVNGVSLRSMDKNDRKLCYKSVVTDGVKRKFCPLCRYSFKDNWAIENHYMSDVCQYTCKWCGRRFKYHKELFISHLRTHVDETPTKIFGPKDRLKFKKKHLSARQSAKKSTSTAPHPKQPVFVGHMVNTYPPRVKPIKIKQLMQKKMTNALKNMETVQIKTEPDLPPMLMNESVSLEASTSSNNTNEPYQAYFCRKCFKVFFNVGEYNFHIRSCTGSGTNTPSTRSKAVKGKNREVSETRVSTPDSSASSGKRRLRPMPQKPSPIIPQLEEPQPIEKDQENTWECGICCSTFPSKYSRNSHMRIHKGQVPAAAPSSKSKLSMASKQDLQKTVAINFMEQQQQHHQQLQQQQQQAQQNPFNNLNPAVARLVQNNPHLTIRSYTTPKQQQQKQQSLPPQMQTPISMSQSKIQNTPTDVSPETGGPKRNYKCADCEEKFENKSILYYHKMNSCIVKRHYECAFCRKKFGTYDQYNTHMFYVHPE